MYYTRGNNDPVVVGVNHYYLLFLKYTHIIQIAYKLNHIRVEIFFTENLQFLLLVYYDKYRTIIEILQFIL